VLLQRLASLLFIAVCLGVLWVLFARSPQQQAEAQPPPRPTRPAPPPLPTEPVALDGAALLGSRDAKVALLTFSEFQCPYCGKYARETDPAIRSAYVDPGKVLMAFRHLPLETSHPFAAIAAEAAVCAGRQDRFWEMETLMFSNQARLDVPSLLSRAQSLELEMGRFATCLEGEATGQVEADMSLARALGVTGTPTFFIGAVQPDGRVKLKFRMSGAQPLGRFQQALDAALDEPMADAQR